MVLKFQRPQIRILNGSEKKVCTTKHLGDCHYKQFQMIRRVGLWTLGILLGSVLAYTGWNGLVTPGFLMGETKVVPGKIIEVFPSREVKTYSRRIKYVYAVDGEYYVDFKKLGTKDKKQAIGNDLRIVYSTKRPQWNKIEKHLKHYRNSNGVKYYSNSEKGYIKMYLINGIFKYEEYVDGGEIVNNYIGEYVVVNDSVQFKNYHFEEIGMDNYKPKQFVFNNANHLVEFDTNRVFKKIKNRRR